MVWYGMVWYGMVWYGTMQGLAKQVSINYMYVLPLHHSHSYLSVSIPGHVYCVFPQVNLHQAVAGTEHLPWVALQPIT
jgi:hypothetical protein